MTATNRAEDPVRTVSHVFGEITWLLSQSNAYSDIHVNDLGWLAIPPITNRQFHIFREGARPIGAALWAFFDAETERKVEQSLTEPKLVLNSEDWTSGDRLWLICLIAPFANQENRQAEVMLADLIAGQFSEKPFRMIYSNPITGARTVIDIGANAKQELIKEVKNMLENAPGNQS